MPSSVILAMQYEPRRRELYIAFRTKREVYRYFDVALDEWRDFLEAGSKGTYLNQVFKRREHPFETIDGPIPPAPQANSDEPMEWGETWVLWKKGMRRVEPETDERDATA
jgi:hypothetical protein